MKNSQEVKETTIKKNTHMMLMEEILRPLRLVVHPVIYKVLYIPGWLFGISSIHWRPEM